MTAQGCSAFAEKKIVLKSEKLVYFYRLFKDSGNGCYRSKPFNHKALV